MNQPDERRRAVGYIRVSSEEQVEGLSLPSQERNVREWCPQRGYDVVDIFREDGITAYTDDIRKRPQFAALLEQLPQLRPDTVVVYSLDRWARSISVAADSFRALASLNIGFASVTEPQ